MKNKMNHLAKYFKEIFNGDTSSKSERNHDYFKIATDWSDDYYLTTLLSRNRYRIAFFSMLALCALLTLSISALMPLVHVEPILIHHYEDGAISVEPVQKLKLPMDQAQVESEIIRYVINRESYDPVSYQEQYSLIDMMSNESVLSEYQRAQRGDNSESVIQTLGNKFVRSVRVESVVFINTHKKSKTDNSNMAEVNFSLIDTNKTTGAKKVKPYIATLTWTYSGIPKDPEIRWRNWDGFTVTSYQLSERAI